MLIRRSTRRLALIALATADVLACSSGDASSEPTGPPPEAEPAATVSEAPDVA